ncbi:hypothetical protein [Novosphingobium sp. M1R2S20]|uniref:Uncharacterized protein n=1 Tax=Novosphingobium rhizovicinum TaxID=3228928 RepID=A0ABV3RB39_9SPHN
MFTEAMNGPARQAQLRGFLRACLASTCGEEAARLQEAAVLMGMSAEDRSVVDAMLACGATESAALLVMGRGRPFLLSQGGTGTCLASAVCADGEEKTAEGATLALAILAAHASALLADIEGSPVAAWRSAPGPHARMH